MATCKFWSDRFNAAQGYYDCPWCDRTLKPKLSNSAKNPGKTFVSCAKDFGGCGLFCFVDAVPNDKFKPGAQQGVKRERSPPRAGGSNIVGPIVNRPDATETRIAELAAAIDRLTTKVDAIHEYVVQINEN